MYRDSDERCVSHCLHIKVESAREKWGRNHHVLHQGRSTPHLYLQEEAFMACNQGQPQEFTIDPGLPLQARKACKQKGGKKFTKQHDVDSNGEDSGKGKFLLPQHYFNDSVWAKTKGAKSTEIHQHVTRIVKLPIPWPSSWSINWNQAPGSHRAGSAKSVKWEAIAARRGSGPKPVVAISWTRVGDCSPRRHCAL